MNDILTHAFNQLSEIIKEDKRCLGGWHFGSVSRGMDDEYSDVDPVFVIDGKYFEEFDNELPQLFERICDKVLLYWAENFNNDEIRNYGFDIQIGEKIYQFDIFLLNSMKTESWSFKIHSTGIKKENIIFDRNGIIAEIVKNAPTGEIPYRNVTRIIDTYWHYIHMITKYFIRQDYFKILHNVRILMDAHAELLLAEYDCITWGGSDSKLRFIPPQKQEHLKQYSMVNDLNSVKKSLKLSMNWFSMDAREICLSKGINYPITVEVALKQEFENL